MGLFDLNNNHNETKENPMYTKPKMERPWTSAVESLKTSLLAIPKLNNKNLRECINGVRRDRQKPR